VDEDRSRAISGIEKSQMELRQSIERAKALSQESERRIRRHRDETLPTNPS
jgi:hypothetical protein